MTDPLRIDERASIALRALYRRHGFLPYPVSTFEEVDLYARSRPLPGSLLTFPGAGGTLMALKPDITLSIARGARAEDAPLRVFYAERVYRIPRGEEEFKEILQTGVELIGGIDDCAMAQTLLLAARSLALLSPAYLLDVSHLGFVSALMDAAALSPADRDALLACIRDKNLHGLRAACAQLYIKEETAALLASLITCSGEMDETLRRFEAMPLPEGCRAPLASLRRLCDLLAAQGVANVNLDFSASVGMDYYSGLVFSGFIAGVPRSVLSGGRYDPLMRRMGKPLDAIGFAVYLDQLDRLDDARAEADVDLLIITGSTDPSRALSLAQAAIAQGKTVRLQPCAGNVRAREILDLTKEGGA